MSQIEMIKLATEKRKKLKKQIDSLITLSDDESKKLADFGDFPILTEGVVVDGGGKPKFAIAKNTLQRMYDEMPNDFEGLIKLSHAPYSDNPIFLGKFKKEDLSIIDYEDDRKQLVCNVKLMSESPLVKQIIIQDNPIGFSIEGYFSYDGDEKLLSEYDFDIYNHLKLLNLSIVGQSADVMVGNVENFKPKGDKKNMGIIAKMKEIFDGASKEELNSMFGNLSEDNTNKCDALNKDKKIEEDIEEFKKQLQEALEENKELKEKLSEKEKEVEMAEEIFEKFEGLKELSTKDNDDKKSKTEKLFTNNAFK